MVSSNSSCAWGLIIPGAVDLCRPTRPERPFYTSFPVGDDETSVIKSATKGLIGVSVVKPNDPDASFALVFAPGASRQQVAQLTSAFLRELTTLIDDSHPVHIARYSTKQSSSEDEIAAAVAINSSPGW